jgi:colanic acid/amylovoran biosynthesis protein
MPQNTVVNSANIKKGELINAFSFLSNNENELRNQLKMKIDKYTKRTWNILEVKNKI